MSRREAPQQPQDVCPDDLLVGLVRVDDLLVDHAPVHLEPVVHWLALGLFQLLGGELAGDQLLVELLVALALLLVQVLLQRGLLLVHLEPGGLQVALRVCGGLFRVVLGGLDLHDEQAVLGRAEAQEVSVFDAQELACRDALLVEERAVGAACVSLAYPSRRRRTCRRLGAGDRRACGTRTGRRRGCRRSLCSCRPSRWACPRGRCPAR